MYTIGEVASKFNLPTHTLRYYEKEGLLPAVTRNDAGVRHYTDLDVEWISLVVCMRSTGMSVGDIKTYIGLAKQGDNTLVQRYEIIEKQKRIIETELDKYQQLLAVVNRKLSYYDEQLKQLDSQNLHKAEAAR